jgi:accessory gene regulator B
MVETICNKLTSRIRKEMPDINDERAEVINYGLQLIIGEIPKLIIIITIAYILKVLDLSILVLILLLPYRTVSGGVHLQSHLGCIVATSVFYIGNAVLSKYIVLTKTVEYIITGIVWMFSMIMIKLYAPADTEEVPILRKKERTTKKILSYIVMTLSLIASLIIKNTVISNLLLFGVLFQTVAITRLMYKITGNKYGYEEYIKINGAK